MKPSARRKTLLFAVPVAVAALTGAAAVVAPNAPQFWGQSSGPALPVRATQGAGSAPATQVVIIGDSLSTGHGTSPDLAWPNLVQGDTRGGQHPLSIVNASANGSGYVSTGDGGSTFLSQVDESVQKTTQLVLIFGSENDMGSDATQLKQAAAKTLAEINAKAPDAKIVVVGPPSYTDNPEASRLEVRDEDRAAANEAGAVFIDPIQDQWIMGQADQLIGPDGDHPSVAGQHYLQANMEKIITGNLPG